MTRSWERNVDSLRAHAQQKSVDPTRRAEAAITHLLKEQRSVNFKTVAETAGISTAWLYGNEALKQRIMHLRAQQVPVEQVKIPQREQASSSSNDTMIAAFFSSQATVTNQAGAFLPTFSSFPALPQPTIFLAIQLGRSSLPLVLLCSA